MKVGLIRLEKSLGIYHGAKHVEEDFQKTKLRQIEDSRFKLPVYEVLNKNGRRLNIYIPTDSGYISIDSADYFSNKL